MKEPWCRHEKFGTTTYGSGSWREEKNIFKRTDHSKKVLGVNQRRRTVKERKNGMTLSQKNEKYLKRRIVGREGD